MENEEEYVWCPICDEYKIPKYMNINEDTISNIYKGFVNDLKEMISDPWYQPDYYGRIQNLIEKYEAMIK